ncbi:hypothetical protein [Cerasicoccus fimbriatus]|uniref:hypothetical protein n=1 Tax=Cerasicoccus fimbriatus TaxID=3014554 RepID=UPI0022B5CD9B|nr:hypothetical protein [Cerasicoccus sp. TK19100]
MRRVLRVIWLIALSVGLLAAVVLFTFRWWVTSAVNAILPPILAEAPLESAKVDMREVGLNASLIDIQEIKAPGLKLTDTEIEVDYAVGQLRRQSVDTVTIRHSNLFVDLDALLGQAGKGAGGSAPMQLPEHFPLMQVLVQGADITLKKGNWRQQFAASADVNFAPRTSFDLSLEGEGKPLDLSGVANFASQSGSVKASWSLEALTHWLKQAPSLGLALPEVMKDLTLAGDASLTATVGNGQPQSVRASAKALPLTVSVAGAELQSDAAEAAVYGQLGESLSARMSLSPASLSWSAGAGRIEGLRGALDPISLQPLGVFAPQTLSFDQFSQGELSANEGRLTFTYQPARAPELDATLEAKAFDGRLTITITGSPLPPRSLVIKVRFDAVNLEELAALMPDFDGRIIGTVSGELGLRFGTEIEGLLPGYLEMKPGTTGRFQFYKQGWVTQDPNLNPVEFAQGKDVLTLLKQPNGATVLTELAMRDLKMTKFRLDVTETQRSAPAKVTISLEGEGEVKGTAVPVVLDVPVTGDVIETINLVLKIQQRM